MSGRQSDPSEISYSEIDTLTTCERQWDYTYRQGFEQDGKGLRIGTAWHLFTDDWWMGRYANGPAVVQPYGLEDPEEAALLAWLIGRYVEHYGPTPAETGLSLYASELEGRVPSPVTGVDLTFHVDKVAEDTQGGLWVVETKSYGSRRRLALLDVTLQETLYTDGVQQMTDRDVLGVLFDGVYTYRWKPKRRTLAEIEAEIAPFRTGLSNKALRLEAKHIQETEAGVERPPADSFDRIWLSREEPQIEEARLITREAILRRGNLQGDRTPLPNIGAHCTFCPARRECWSTLVGREDYGDVEIEWEDDDEGPA